VNAVKEITAVNSENHTKHIFQNDESLDVEAGETYSYHWALKGSRQFHDKF
jgi:hypothetical protein